MYEIYFEGRIEKQLLTKKNNLMSQQQQFYILDDIEIYDKDLKDLTWDDANNACIELGEGWRLPTKKELSRMYRKKKAIGGFSNTWYWSSENEYIRVLTQYFGNGAQDDNHDKWIECNLRPVRNIK